MFASPCPGTPALVVSPDPGGAGSALGAGSGLGAGRAFALPGALLPASDAADAVPLSAGGLEAGQPTQSKARDAVREATMTARKASSGMSVRAAPQGQMSEPMRRRI